MRPLDFFSLLGQALLLVLALSLDSFVAGIAYGAGGIKIPKLSLLTLGGVSTSVLTLSLLAGELLGPLFPAEAVHIVCFLLLFSLGVFKLFDGVLKSAIRARGSCRFSFSALNLNFILQVYAEPERADADHGGTLSPKEAFALALALSLDGLAAGFGASLSGGGVFETALLSLPLSCAAVAVGELLGRRMHRKGKIDLTPLSGVLLILLALLKL